MKTIRIAAWSLIAILCAVVAFVVISRQMGTNVAELAGARIGGPFTLTRTDGTVVTDKDILGKPHALFFGYTHCPEVCPTTLWEASGWLKQLGSDADRFVFYFVTIDPERDTKETLAQYMTSFDPRITGLTGTVAQVEQIKQDYHVFARKVPLEDGDYSMDHTASVYLLHSDGSFAGTLAYQEKEKTVMEKLRKLIDKG